MVSHHPAKFSGHKLCGSGDIMVLVSPVILEGHVTKVSGNSLGKSPSRYITILPSLVSIGTVTLEIQWFQFVSSSCKNT